MISQSNSRKFRGNNLVIAHVESLVCGYKSRSNPAINLIELPYEQLYLTIIYSKQQSCSWIFNFPTKYVQICIVSRWPHKHVYSRIPKKCLLYSVVDSDTNPISLQQCLAYLRKTHLTPPTLLIPYLEISPNKTFSFEIIKVASHQQIKKNCRL